MPRQAIEIHGIEGLIDRFRLMGNELITTELLDEIALYIISQIQARTSGGEDVDGNSFTPYTPEYSAFRDRTGHPTDKVNLFYTGSMLASMTFDTSQDEVEIFFQNTTDPSGSPNPLKAFALNEERRFFAISVDEQDEIEEIVREHLNNLVRGQRG
jgi:hypothetical protein